MAKPSVLIVEDEPDIADLIRFHCEREGMDARAVGTGKVAIELVKREELDAALELARRAREGQEALEARVAALEARLAELAAAPGRKGRGHAE